jgi:hypothetical protein
MVVVALPIEANFDREGVAAVAPSACYLKNESGIVVDTKSTASVHVLFPLKGGKPHADVA